MTCSKIPAHRIWDFFAQLVVCILEIEAPAQNSHETNENCTEQGLKETHDTQIWEPGQLLQHTSVLSPCNIMRV
jgi:hypothetical protein